MKKNSVKAQADLAIFICGLIVLVFLLLSPSSRGLPDSLYAVDHDAGAMLRTGHSSDLQQDVIGFREFCKNRNPYPILGPALEKLGIPSDLKHASTHPPTAFLLVAPIAWMPINAGARVWAWLMVACIAGSFYCLGCSVLRSVGLAFLCLPWPPIAYCLGQLTAIWLLGVCGSYRYFANKPALSGFMLGLASATKIAPAILVFLLLRSRTSLIGFAMSLALFVGVLVVVSPFSISNYLLVNAREVPHQFDRPDNGSIIAQASHYHGKWGRLLVMAFLASVIAANLREVNDGSLIGWSVLSYVAVAALPILWVYSIVPLLFLVRWAILGGLLHKLFFFSFVLATTVFHIWSSPKVLALTVVWLGLGLIVTGLQHSNPFKSKMSVVGDRLIVPSI